MLEKIYSAINEKNFDYAEELLLHYETESKKGAIYWNLMGYMNCIKGDITKASNCYVNAIKANAYNFISIQKIIEIGELAGVNTTEFRNLFQENALLIEKDIFLYISKLTMLECNDENINSMKSLCPFKVEDLVLCNDANLITSSTCDEILNIPSFDEFPLNNKKVLVIFDSNYMRNIELLAKKNLDSCYVLVNLDGNKSEFVFIDNRIMKELKAGKRKQTITMHMLNNSDSNVYALRKYIPTKYKDKYVINMLYDSQYYELDNIVKMPLVSSVYVSGHGTFSVQPYPELVFNFEVGHGSVSFKACGLMNPDVWYASPKHYKNLDKLCVTSMLDMIEMASFCGLSRDKYIITGAPRTDTLIFSDGRQNLERLIGKSITGKKVIFNLPTFHHHEKTGRLEGDKELTGFIKMKDFDYKEFDEFLQREGYICITKVHYLDENTMANKNLIYNTRNMYAFSNKDLELLNLDFYELLNSTDVLITDYSSVYGDFLFMDKPTVFLNCDIEDYRKNRGLILEPYDFWTAGAKVDNQIDLEVELKNAIELDMYKDKRSGLRQVYHAYLDGKATERAWDYINEYLENNKEIL